MSDDVLSVLPTDPYWQPDRGAVHRAAAATAALAPAAARADIAWYDTPVLVDCGPNLDRIGCPHCGAPIGTGWWADRLEHARSGDGFAPLAVTVPCCDTPTSLEALDYDWPCGFARFRIILCHPERDWFDQEETNALARALGHPVCQVRARI